MRWGKPTVLDNGARQATTIVAVPSLGITFRNLNFPFADRRKLEPLVAQELEHSLAFPLSEAVWDLNARAPGPDVTDNVFAVAVPRTRLSSSLERLGNERPTVIDVEPYAYQRILALAGIGEAMVLDLGYERSTVCRVLGGHVDYVRGLMRGGKHLTDQIAQARRGNAAEAEQLKVSRGMELPEAREYYQRLLEDAMLPQEGPSVPLYLTGGGSRTPGLAEWLADRTKRAVQLLPVPEGVNPHEDAVAYGMALWGVRGGESVNLQSQMASSNAWLGQVAAWIAVILVVISLDVGIRAALLKREVARYDSAIASVVKTAAPDMTVMYDPLGQLRSRVADQKSKTTGSGRDMLPLLESVSKAVAAVGPAGPDGKRPVRISELSVNGGFLKLKGSAQTPKMVQALQDGLKDLGQAGAEQQSDPSGGYSFTVTVDLGKS